MTGISYLLIGSILLVISIVLAFKLASRPAKNKYIEPADDTDR